LIDRGVSQNHCFNRKSMAVINRNSTYKLTNQKKKLTRARRLLRHDCFLESIGLDAVHKHTHQAINNTHSTSSSDHGKLAYTSITNHKAITPIELPSQTLALFF